MDNILIFSVMLEFMAVMFCIMSIFIYSKILDYITLILYAICIFPNIYLEKYFIALTWLVGTLFILLSIIYKNKYKKLIEKEKDF